MQMLISSLVGVVIFATLDYVWLAHIAKDFYLNTLRDHVVIEKGSLVPFLPAVPIVYIIAIITIIIFAFPRAATVHEGFLYGGLLGFCLYGFYDLTNMATLKGYTLSLTVLDTLWGMFAMAVVTAVMVFVRNLLA